MNNKKKHIIAAAIIILLLLIDQAIKIAVKLNMNIGEEIVAYMDVASIVAAEGRLNDGIVPHGSEKFPEQLGAPDAFLFGRQVEKARQAKRGGVLAA